MPYIKLTKSAFANYTGPLLGAVFTNGVSNNVPLATIDAIAAAIGGNLVQADGTTVIGPAGKIQRETAIRPARPVKTWPRSGAAGATDGIVNRSRSKKFLGQVATRCNTPSGFYAGNQFQMSRHGHFARDYIVSLQLVLPNFYLENGVEKLTGGIATFKASVEYPAGTFTAATFGGETQIKSSDGLVITDPIRVSIPINKKFWSKVWRNDPKGVLFHGLTAAKSNATHGDAYHVGANIGTVPDNTLNTTATNDDANNTYSPVAIIAWTAKGSVIYFGDSLAAGQGDAQDASGDNGLFRAIGADLGYSNQGLAGDHGIRFFGSSAIRRSLIQYFTDVILQHGINDLGSGGRTAAQLLAERTATAELIRTDYPGVRIWGTTVAPQVTNNTNAAAAPGTNTKRIEFNNLMRKVPAPFDGNLDIADALENSRNGGLFGNNTWINGADGTHPTQAGYLQVGTSGLLHSGHFAA